ncbi:MAG: NAD(P)-binding domain-containing protein [Ktedonobacteraceae bacterium]
MNIGIIGSGNIGANVARLFAKAGHHVAISNSRGPQSLASLVTALGSNVTATTVDDAAKFAEVVLLAVPWRTTEALPSAKLLAGKIVIDAMNHYTSTGDVHDLGYSTSSEEVAKRLPGVRLVKAFNTMYFETLRTGGKQEQNDRLVLFVAGDDIEAKAVVSKLIEDIGFASVDTGSLHQGGRLQQPGSAIYNKPLTTQQAQKLLAGQ